MKSIRPGKYRDWIRLLEPSPTVDDGGGISDAGYREMANGTVPAEVKPGGGQERWNGQQLQAVGQLRITTRYRSDFAALGIRGRVYLLPSGPELEVADLIDWENRHVEMTLTCFERQAA